MLRIPRIGEMMSSDFYQKYRQKVKISFWGPIIIGHLLYLTPPKFEKRVLLYILKFKVIISRPVLMQSTFCNRGSAMRGDHQSHSHIGYGHQHVSDYVYHGDAGYEEISRQA